jgi:transposase
MVIEIALEGAVIRVPPGSDASTLTMVLQALKSVR